MRDLLAASALGRDLGDDDREILLDGARMERFERGARLFEPGDRADRCFVLVDGLVQIQSEEDGRASVVAYLGRGDLFGDEEALAGAPRGAAAVAAGDSWCASVAADVLRTVSDRNPGLIPRLRRIAHRQRADQGELVAAAAARSTQHVFRDLYRMQVARSLLVIDQDSCVRCGHCAWSCAEVHGVSRLVRRGDKVVTRLDAGAAGPASLLLPNTCQHCRHAACMIDCPTGAIGRDPEGEVFIRPELCTGCGNCAKACPWENIQMAPRAGAGSARVCRRLCRSTSRSSATCAGATRRRRASRGVRRRRSRGSIRRGTLPRWRGCSGCGWWRRGRDGDGVGDRDSIGVWDGIAIEGDRGTRRWLRRRRYR